MRIFKLFAFILFANLSHAQKRPCYLAVSRELGASVFKLEYEKNFVFGDDNFQQKAIRHSDLDPREQKTVSKLINKSLEAKFTRRYAVESALRAAPPHSVEVGIIVLTTKDGSRIEFLHTSAHPKLIDLEHFNKSFYEGLKNTGRTEADIVDFKYYHTHPPLAGRDVSPLSDYDYAGLMDIQNFFQDRGMELPINLYAVEPFRDQGRPVVWTFVE